MTLNPADVMEAWCHERGYVCLIEEIGGRPIKAGHRSARPTSSAGSIRSKRWKRYMTSTRPQQFGSHRRRLAIDSVALSRGEEIGTFCSQSTAK